MHPAHLRILRAAIVKHDWESRRNHYAAPGLSDERYRWDLARYAVPNFDRWMCDVLYSYLDDEHIDTALRSIVQPLPRT